MQRVIERKVFVHRPRGCIQKFRWGKKPICQNISSPKRHLRNSRKAVSYVWNTPLVLPRRMETCYWGAKVCMLKSGLTLLHTTGFLSSGALQEEDAARSAPGEVPLPGWVFGGAFLPGSVQSYNLEHCDTSEHVSLNAIPGCLRLSGEDEKKLQSLWFWGPP